MKKTLDFICIGAPKSATSTLFELIETHPDVYVPPSKEVPFFNDDETYGKGWDWYMKTFFQHTEGAKSVGTMTPQYMTGLKKNTPELIAQRIHKQLPNVRIIALLRHPIGRSYSQFKMHQRNGYIKSSFTEAVNRLLGHKNLEQERAHLTPQKNQFLFASEYGRILSAYYNLFPKKNILVLYTDDFQKDPKTVLKRLFDFLGVDNRYLPPDVGRHSHQGGGKAKIKFLAPAYLHKMKPVNYVWKKVVPAPWRKKVFMKVTRWNIKPDNAQLDPHSDIYKDLVGFFADDIRQLEKLTGQKVPWTDWR